MAVTLNQSLSNGCSNGSLMRNPNLGLHSAEVKKQTLDNGAIWERNIRGDQTLEGERHPDYWTGLKPSPGLPGVRSDGTVFSLPLINVSMATREQLLAYFNNTWMLTEVLFSSLQGEEAFFRPPYHNLRHPLIFYFAHPAALYVNKLRVAGLLDKPVNEYYEVIFETGVDEMSWDDLNKNEMLWPSVAEVIEYRRTVYSLIKNLILTHPDLDQSKLPFDQASKGWALVMGFEHERIHLETSSVLIRELPLHLVRRPVQWPAYHPSVHLSSSDTPTAGKDYLPTEFKEVAAQRVTLHKPHDWPTFGWDNEYGSRDFDVEPFQAGRCLVTNGEFWEFVKAGGYSERSHWTDDGWGWRSFRNAKWPTFWVPHGPSGLHRYRLRALFDVVDMRWNWPVCVNCHEAKAYANWQNSQLDLHPNTIRLPAEQEMVLLRNAGTVGDVDPVMVAGGDTMAEKFGLNTQLAFGSESPVTALAANALGFHDTCGNVWEWGEGYFCALPGFKIHPYYDDFSTPCFDGKHAVFMKGSFASTGDECSRFARFHFRPHFFQHSGFRLVKSAHLETSDMDAPPPYVGKGPWATKKPKEGQALYESQKYIDEYLSLHFGTDEELMPHAAYRSALSSGLNWPKCLAELCAKHATNKQRALDVGCAVGCSSFELAQEFAEVIGIDFSSSFINTANKLKEKGELPYKQKREGDVYSQHTARVNPVVDRKRVSFQVGDACSLPDTLGQFDAVLLANLLCRLPSPQSCLQRLSTLVRCGGVVIIASPYSWMEQFTPHDKWLGGFVNDGKEVHARDTIQACLSGSFDLIEEGDLALVIREHYRKYQLVISQLLVFRRK